MTFKEKKRYRELKSSCPDKKNRWWYSRGFATGLLLLDEGDEMYQELDYIREIMKDMEEIAIEDGLARDAFIPAMFTVGMKHAMCIANFSQVPIAQMQTKATLPRVQTTPVVRLDLRRRALGRKLQDEIAFIKIGRGHLAIRPRPSAQQLGGWKLDVLVTLSETHKATKRMCQLEAIVEKCHQSIGFCWSSTFSARKHRKKSFPVIATL